MICHNPHYLVKNTFSLTCRFKDITRINPLVRLMNSVLLCQLDFVCVIGHQQSWRPHQDTAGIAPVLQLKKLTWKLCDSMGSLCLLPQLSLLLWNVVYYGKCRIGFEIQFLFTLLFYFWWMKILLLGILGLPDLKCLIHGGNLLFCLTTLFLLPLLRWECIKASSQGKSLLGPKYSCFFQNQGLMSVRSF